MTSVNLRQKILLAFLCTALAVVLTWFAVDRLKKDEIPLRGVFVYDAEDFNKAGISEIC